MLHGGVFIKTVLLKNWFWTDDFYHSGVTAIFWKNDAIFQ